MNHITVRITDTTGHLEHRTVEITLADPPTTSAALPPLPALEPLDLTRSAMGPRFIKIGDAGEQLPADAASWVAVRDTATGLEWQVDVDETRRTWSDAKEYCDQLELATYADWRLPTIKELLTLVDYERHEPAIDTSFFPDCPESWFWSASPAAWAPSRYAWVVGFGNGLAGTAVRASDGFVRAVRSVASPGQ